MNPIFMLLCGLLLGLCSCAPPAEETYRYKKVLLRMAWTERPDTAKVTKVRFTVNQYKDREGKVPFTAPDGGLDIMPEEYSLVETDNKNLNFNQDFQFANVIAGQLVYYLVTIELRTESGIVCYKGSSRMFTLEPQPSDCKQDGGGWCRSNPYTYDEGVENPALFDEIEQSITMTRQGNDAACKS